MTSLHKKSDNISAHTWPKVIFDSRDFGVLCGGRLTPAQVHYTIDVRASEVSLAVDIARVH